MLEAVAAALTAMGGKATFAAQTSCPADVLGLKVEGVGAIELPVSTMMARKLAKVSTPAPYGRKQATLHNKRVRDTGEIAAGRLSFGAGWRATLDAELEKLRLQLGLAREARLVATLDKLLIYGPGQFFTVHQDSERADDMVATLVIELPSEHSGGMFEVRHHKATKTLVSAPYWRKELSLFAFFADCRHEVKPVESGYRITLSYHLLLASPAPSARALKSSGLDRLTDSIRAYFESREGDETGAFTADRLVYLLDHEYTEKSLAWGRLKGADRDRAAALAEAADRLDCDVALALADVHENWTCDDDGVDNRWDHEDEYDDDDDDDDVEEDPEDLHEDAELGELIDTEIELRHLLRPDGRQVRGVVRPPGSEVCATLESVELKPYQSEYEGYMGNYGNTMDRWYHRAAVVLSPRSRAFELQAKASPAWAVGQLAKLLKSGKRDEAQNRAKSLAPFWTDIAQGEGVAFARKLIDVAISLEDRDLAFAMLLPLEASRLTGGAAKPFARLVEEHGLVWSKRLFEAWSAGWSYAEHEQLAGLPALCEAIAGGKTGQALGRWLLERQRTLYEQERRLDLKQPPAELAQQTVRIVKDTLLLLRADSALSAPESRDSLVRFLVNPKTALPLELGEAILRRALDLRLSPGLERLHRWAVDAVRPRVSHPPRATGDWHIKSPSSCTCANCKILSKFLADPIRTELQWSLAAESRDHVERVIRNHELPVRCYTRRQGRPYVLVLTKQQALFTREAARRSKDEQLLQWLLLNEGEFATD